MTTVKRIFLWLWPVLFGVAHASAAVLHTSENRTWDFFTVGYDAVGDANFGYDSYEKPFSGYDAAPARVQTDSESGRGEFAPLFLCSVDYLPQREFPKA